MRATYQRSRCTWQATRGSTICEKHPKIVPASHEQNLKKKNIPNAKGSTWLFQAIKGNSTASFIHGTLWCQIMRQLLEDLLGWWRNHVCELIALGKWMWVKLLRAHRTLAERTALLLAVWPYTGHFMSSKAVGSWCQWHWCCCSEGKVCQGVSEPLESLQPLHSFISVPFTFSLRIIWNWTQYWP